MEAEKAQREARERAQVRGRWAEFLAGLPSEGDMERALESVEWPVYMHPVNFTRYLQCLAGSIRGVRVSFEESSNKDVATNMFLKFECNPIVIFAEARSFFVRMLARTFAEYRKQAEGENPGIVPYTIKITWEQLARHFGLNPREEAKRWLISSEIDYQGLDKPRAKPANADAEVGTEAEAKSNRL